MKIRTMQNESSMSSLGRWLMSSSSRTRVTLARVEIVGLFAAIAAVVLYVLISS